MKEEEEMKKKETESCRVQHPISDLILEVEVN